MRGIAPIDPESTCVLMGAGVSVDPPSSIPAAIDLMDVLSRWVSTGDRALGEALARLRIDPRRRRPYQGPYATLRFELLLDWLVYFRPEVIRALASIESNGRPNRWHWWAASLIRDGATVVTTNFDTRIEQACRASQVPMRRSVIAGSAPSVTRLKGSGLIKLHGTFSGPASKAIQLSPVGTLQQIARFGLGYGRLSATRRALLDRLKAGTLVVCGYSAWDSFDVMPLIESLSPATRIVWFDWRPRGPLRHVGIDVHDHLLAWQARLTPIDMFFALRAERGGSSSTQLLRGPGTQFLDAIWATREERAFMEALNLTMLPVVPSRSNLNALRQTLGALEPLSSDEARLIVETISRAYGNERVADQQLEDLPEQPRFRGQVALLRELDRGDIKSAAHRFVREIERNERGEDRQVQAENLVWILEKMFWHALQLRKHSVAAQSLFGSRSGRPSLKRIQEPTISFPFF